MQTPKLFTTRATKWLLIIIIMRDIKKIIVHSTATPEGRHHTVADIDKWHRQRGFNGIGYHYVVYLDGSVHEGRDVSRIGAHTSGHNATSIGVCYVGGVDAVGEPKDTRTPEQRHALRKLIDELRAKYPGATLHGHRDFAATACPSFDVKTEL